MFYDEHSDLKLVVIDILKMIRSSVRDYSYSSDYHELADLKRFATSAASPFCSSTTPGRWAITT